MTIAMLMQNTLRARFWTPGESQLSDRRSGL